MASGAARRKRKRENAKREAWEAYARAGGNDEAYASAMALEAAAKRERDAAKRRRADVEALNEEAGGGERNADGGAGASGAALDHCHCYARAVGPAAVFGEILGASLVPHLPVRPASLAFPARLPCRGCAWVQPEDFRAPPPLRAEP